jgi:hypothetical protein
MEQSIPSDIWEFNSHIAEEIFLAPFLGKWRLGGPPLVINPSQVKDLLAILDDATIAVEKEIGF